jgi:hypothetical protein
MDYFCTGCGEYTTRRLFGKPLCEPCHIAEDDAVEAYERQQAKRYGYRYGWRDDE